MSELPADMAACAATIPAAMDALNESHASVKQIADYCKSSFKDGGEHVTETKEYTNQALQNVVYHVHHVGLQLATFLEFQSKELEKIDLQIKTLTQRMRACHDTTGTFQKQGIEAPKLYQRSNKALKLDDLPPSAEPLDAYARVPLDLSALDGVGRSGAVEFGEEAYSAISTSSQAPPAEAAAPSPSPSGVSSPPAMAAPPAAPAPVAAPTPAPPPAPAPAPTPAAPPALPRDEGPAPADDGPPPLPRDGGGGPPPLPRDGGGPPPLPRDGGGGPPPLPRDGGGGPPPLPRDGGGPPPLPRDGGGGPPPLPRDGGGPPPLPRDGGGGGPPPLPRD